MSLFPSKAQEKIRSLPDLADFNRTARLRARGEGKWIQTKTGKRFPMDGSFRPDQVCLEDIAHSLSMQCRYGGLCSRFYSVAEHSIHVMRRVRELTEGIPDQDSVLRSALMHDAGETYVGDIVSPLKQFLGQPIKDLEAATMRAIALRYGLKDYHCAVIKQADLECLLAEARDLFDPPPLPGWAADVPFEPWEGLRLGCWTPEEAKERFYAVAHMLGIRD